MKKILAIIGVVVLLAGWIFRRRALASGDRATN